MNVNPIYLIEGRFLNAAKKFWNADKKFAKQRYFGGKGRELVEPIAKEMPSNLGGVRNPIRYTLGVDKLNGRITADQEAKFLSDVDNYIQKKDAWNAARSELWGETKALPGRAWRKAKRMFTRDNPRNINPINNYVTDEKGNILPYALAGGGLGLLGFTTLANSPEITAGTPDQ